VGRLRLSPPRLISALLLLTLLAAAQTTADFYVAPTGNDNNVGTIDSPFATLDRARAAVRTLKQQNGARSTPIVVMLRGGVYFLPAILSFTAADSGTAQAPIVYQSYPGETPVISGGQPITGWHQAGAGMWAVALPAAFRNFEQLFVNGQRRYRPRTTKTGYLYNAGPVYMTSSAPGCPTMVQGRGFECYDRFRFKPGDLQATYHNITDVEIDDFEKWTMSKMRLQSVDTVNNIAMLTGATPPDTNHGFLPGHRYLVENVKEALSKTGEWYLDRATTPWTLTYLPQPGEDLSSAVVIAPQLTQLIVATNLSYITFKGLAFSHDNWVVPAAGH
jgi:hypothetical protein